MPSKIIVIVKIRVLNLIFRGSKMQGKEDAAKWKRDEYYSSIYKQKKAGCTYIALCTNKSKSHHPRGINPTYY